MVQQVLSVILLIFIILSFFCCCCCCIPNVRSFGLVAVMMMMVMAMIMMMMAYHLILLANIDDKKQTHILLIVNTFLFELEWYPKTFFDSSLFVFLFIGRWKEAGAMNQRISLKFATFVKQTLFCVLIVFICNANTMNSEFVLHARCICTVSTLKFILIDSIRPVPKIWFRSLINVYILLLEKANFPSLFQ